MESLNSSRAAILEKFLELGRARNLAALRAMVTEDIQIKEAESLPFGGEYVGWAGYLELTNKVFGKSAKCV